MKIIFEAVNGKKGSKEFKSLSEAKAFVLRNKKAIKSANILKESMKDWGGDGNLVSYVGKAKRRWKTAFDNGLILKGKTYYIEDKLKPQGTVQAVNVYDDRKQYLFSMAKDKIGNYFEASELMEGPLGSGGFGIGKALKNRKKANDRVKNFNDIDRTKDSFNMNIMKYIQTMVKEVAEWEFGPELDGLLSAWRDEHGYFIFSYEDNVYRNIRTDDEDKPRKVNMKSDKYHNKIYMPKLTKYVEQHKSLPSEKQVKEYIKKLIEKRYENNLNKMKKIKPHSLYAEKDVDNF